MTKVLRIAMREFVTTVFTKAFLIGLLFLPIMIVIGVFVVNLFDEEFFLTEGEVAVVDPTGLVAERMREAITEGTEAADFAEESRQAAIANFGSDDFEEALTQPPNLTLLVRDRDADPEEEKQWLLVEGEEPERLALVVVHADAIAPSTPRGEYGSYDLFVPADVDNRAAIAIHSIVREAIVSLRVEALGLDRQLVNSATRIDPVDSVTVTEDSEQANAGAAFNVILPIAFMFLLFMGVMGGGQGLLTTTITEKSSRVIEVLLSAVSPMQLMAGKLIGHMSVSLVGMSVYLLGGLFVLSSFSMFGLLEPMLIVYLFIFFFITYFVVGSFMMAIGAAVNDLNEAQSLMMPVTLMLILPWLLWVPVTRNPSSTVSVVFSFLPPVNSFGMLLRISSTEPPPAWQVWLSIAIGCLAVYAMLWFAAKVFRIGLLLHGKPPDFRTLVRWVRQA